MAEEIEVEASSGAPLADLGGAILDDGALRDLLQKLALLADHAIDHAQSVSVTVVEDGRYRTINSTGPEALAMDVAQYREDDGPGLPAIRSGDQLRLKIDDLQGAAPALAEEARRSGVGQVMSTPLVRGGGGVMGAVNVYVREGGGRSVTPAPRHRSARRHRDRP